MIKQRLHLPALYIIFFSSYILANEPKQIPPIKDTRQLHDKMLSHLSEKSRIADQQRKIAQQNLSSLKASKKSSFLRSLLMGSLAVAGGIGSHYIHSTKTAVPDQGPMTYGQRFQSFADAIRILSAANIETSTYIGTALFALITVGCSWSFIGNWSSEASAEDDCSRAIEAAATCSEALAELYNLVHPKPIIPTDKPAPKDAPQTQAQTAPNLQPEHVPNASTAVTVQVNIPTNQNNGE